LAGWARMMRLIKLDELFQSQEFGSRIRAIMIAEENAAACAHDFLIAQIERQTVGADNAGRAAPGGRSVASQLLVCPALIQLLRISASTPGPAPDDLGDPRPIADEWRRFALNARPTPPLILPSA